MWIIYRLWGFLLLKPALGVLQIPAQSIATQWSLLSLLNPTLHLFLLRQKNDIIEICILFPHFMPFLTHSNNQKAKSNCAWRKGIWENLCGRHTPLTSYFLNDRQIESECDKKSRDPRCWGGNAQGGNVQGISIRSQWEMGQRCLLRPINRETFIVL